MDLRNPDDELMRRAEADLIEYYAEVERQDRVKVAWRQTARTETVRFAETVMDRDEGAARARGLATERIVSGAGHDAQELARVTRAGMVFVPGEHDGISHNPREHSTVEQCRNGVNVLLQVVLRLAEE